VKCEQCQTENKQGAKFCAKCGAALSVTLDKPMAIEPTKACPQCDKSLKLDAKFCGGCGYKFEQHAASQIVQVEIPVPKPEIYPVQPAVNVVLPVQSATPVESAAVLTKSCPKCKKTLKDDARFCGGCGHNFVTTGQSSVSALVENENENATQPVRQPVQPEIKVVEPPAKVAAQDTSAIAVEFVREKVVAAKSELVSAEKMGMPIAIIAGGIFVVVALIAGGGFYYYKSHAGRSDVAAKVEAQPNVPPVPASAIPSAPVTAEIPVSAPVAVPVLEPKPVKTLPVASAPNKSREPAKQKGETQDDRKLLNAIDQYMDKQH